MIAAILELPTLIAFQNLSKNSKSRRHDVNYNGYVMMHRPRRKFSNRHFLEGYTPGGSAGS